MRRAKRHRRKEEPGLCAGRASEREERERERVLAGGHRAACQVL